MNDELEVQRKDVLKARKIMAVSCFSHICPTFVPPLSHLIPTYEAYQRHGRRQGEPRDNFLGAMPVQLTLNKAVKDCEIPGTIRRGEPLR